MFQQDGASRGLGMHLVEATSGRAELTMVVTDEHVNGLDVCHGGLIFTLADSAMAFASNADNQVALAAHGDIYWMSPARRGDRLTATATLNHQQGRTGVYDVSVTNQNGHTVAVFRGQTRSAPTQAGPHVKTQVQPE